jgi:ATP-dependent helicase/nuclease subunit B
VVLVPEDFECTGLEREFLAALPAKQRTVLPVDRVETTSNAASAESTDLGLLRWLLSPPKAPPPVNDGSALIFRAVGEANEVREVLRRCLATGNSLDQVEILVTDLDNYATLLFEIVAGLMPDRASLDEMPVTFQEGIPVRQFRPGRALIGWLAWVRDGYPQSALVRMIDEGLLEIPDHDRNEFSYSRLVGVLRGVGIGFGRDRYLQVLDEQISALDERLREPEQIRNEDDGGDPERLQRLRKRLKALRLLRGLIAKILSLSPPGAANRLEILQSAAGFVEQLARTAGQLDNYARGRLIAEISDLQRWLGKDESSLNLLDWLTALPNEAMVGGSSPRSGCLHVAHVLAGGHSGRKHTFIMGLDDARFPGAGLQDPVLLDSERRLISQELPTAAGQLQERLVRIAQLLARLRGTVTLSYSCHDLADDREKFPSPVILSAFRILAGQHQGDQADLTRWLPPAASFAPDSAEKSLTESEWWLWRLSGPEIVSNAREVLGDRFPHLSRGYNAAAERASDKFTIYDGWIPAPGTELNPTAPDGPTVSASRLEKLGQCPLAYFFKYVLEIEPPDELEIDPNVWLDPLTSGSLLHSVFERYFNELIACNQVPVANRDMDKLLKILDGQISSQRRLIPPPSEAVFQRQCRELKATVSIFLHEEEEWYQSTGAHPMCTEVSIGIKPEGAGTSLDAKDPVVIALPSEGSLRIRGRIDRVDRLNDGSDDVLDIWDYKTGSAWKYQQHPPFWQGRVVQHILYLELMKARMKSLKKEFPKARVQHFGFFFPSKRSAGERIQFNLDQLAAGGAILQRLARIAANGAFIATNESKDCDYCEYRRVCGDVVTLTARSQCKLINPNTHTILQPFLELRSDGEAKE